MVTTDSEKEGGKRGHVSGKVVPSLVSLTLTKVQRMLTTAVKSSSWPKHKQILTHAVLTHVPHHLRQILQNKLLHDWRLYDTISLRLLELLLSPATNSLRLAHVRVFFHDAFLALLHRLTGLQELTLQDSVWTLSRQQVGVMADALSYMTHLRVLILHHCGHNLLLAAVASNCPHLQVVSVRGSRAVDDSGVWSLVTVPPRRPGPPHRAHRKANISWYTVVKSLISVSTVLDLIRKEDKDRAPLKVLPSPRPSSDSISSRDSSDDFSLSSPCSSLTLVDVRCTSVTSAGIFLLTQALQPHAHLAYDTYQD
ncbi:hypothetical protein GWK47_008564 [Chionoecetes opilio]|uniref:Uncharacterized protein n=1 Tax=Chionoecetes opilio TaxID=41210 RepID=A0A8J5CQ32_CHIOP|nr:hypothetical protein GWK47_008564 [Chionoecetes opilio]